MSTGRFPRARRSHSTILSCGRRRRRLKPQNGSKPRRAGMTFSPNRRIERIRSGSGRSEKLNSPMKTLNRPELGRGADFFRHRLGRADEDQLVLHEIVGVEEIGHDLGGAGLAAADEFLRMLARTLLEGFTGLWRRQESLIGPRGARQCDVERLLVGFVDIDDRAIGDLGRLPVTGGRPVCEELAIARRGIGARIDQKISRVDSVSRAEFERLRIAAHHPERRVRFLRRLHREQGALSAMNLSVKREGLRFAIGRPQVLDEFKRGRFAQVVVEAERLEIVRVDARYQPELHAPADHLVDECDLLCQP